MLTPFLLALALAAPVPPAPVPPAPGPGAIPADPPGAPAPGAPPAAAASPSGQSGSPLPAEPGWRAARFGMTPGEVLAAFPGEAQPMSPEVKLADGNVLAVRIDGHSLEGMTFDVKFVFTDGRLALVSLRTPAKKPVEADAYVRLREALTRQWGAPLQETKDDNFIDMRQTRWSRGPTRVDLKYIPGVVAIVFYPTPPP